MGTLQELVQRCIDRGILVTPEMLNEETLAAALRTDTPYSVRAVKNYTKEPGKRTVKDFVRHFNKRFKALQEMLRRRTELQDTTSIGRLIGKRERERVAFIGMVYERRQTHNKHTLLTVEDPTGMIEVWVHKDNEALSRTAREIVNDEVIGVLGQAGNGRVFADEILFPDTPVTKELKKGHREAYVAFVGDVEIGSKLFMRDAFSQFIRWTRGEEGNDAQKEIASKLGYVVFIGDLVHGVGIYPGQANDSDILDIRQQYEAFTTYVKKIPPHIQIILIPGNHDAGRLQEPQLPIYADLAEELYALPNVTSLSNPSVANIERTPDHPGFDLLLYHGYSLIYFTQEVQPIKDAGGMKAMDLAMKLYLRKRHLAPTHGSNTYVPDPDEDPLVIDTVPDFLVTGHTHTIGHGTYNGTTLINAGCWNDVSDEQMKRGLEPDPARLPIVNLKTRELSVIDFR